jgi:hypothetical protein
MLPTSALVLRTIFKSTHRSLLLLLIPLRSIPTSRSALFLLAWRLKQTRFAQTIK